ncbi:hypothetical protein FRC12_005797 [Ceratobasidium sp. 428]|nr:hypothetical protein FRC12_005797 [Ceratobasidium sp. 428]
MLKLYIVVAIIFCLASSYAALPALRRREVPQEHSHEPIILLCDRALKVNNPEGILDAIFGLLDSDGASIGRGTITDSECVQAATADRAFTNAKALNDIPAMTAALQYRTLERNTNKVGARSPNCTSFKPVNPEIAALSQHQDPAAIGAAVGNKVLVLELARQIKAIGGNPQDALKTGTFKAGDPNDPTAKGNSCNDKDDPAGCIFSKSLMVQDVTPEEINAAVGAPSDGGNTDTPIPDGGSTGTPVPDGNTDCFTVQVVMTITDSPTPTPAA